MAEEEGVETEAGRNLRRSGRDSESDGLSESGKGTATLSQRALDSGLVVESEL